jgi:hypothetical protein
MTHPLRSAAWLLLLLALATSPAHADRKEDGRAAADRGDRAFRKGSYADALAEYQASWDRYPRPFLLFRLAECHRNLGHDAEALAAYRSYLDKVRRGSDRRKAEQHAAELEQKVAAAKVPEPAPPPVPVVQSSDVEAPPQDSQQIAAQERERERRRKHAKHEPKPARASVASASSGPKPPLYKRWWLWTAVGGGVAIAVGLGVGLGLGLNYFDSELPPGGPGASALSLRGTSLRGLGVRF